MPLSQKTTQIGAFLMSLCFWLSLAGCSTKALEWNGSSSISGTVLPLASSASLSAGMSRAASASSAVCSSATANLFRLDNAGVRIEPALAVIPVSSDGTYSFAGVRSLGVKMEGGRRINGAYVVDIAGCGSALTRLLTGSKTQDISWGSTLLSYGLNTPQAGSLLSASPVRLETLYADLHRYDSFSTAYAALVTSTPLRAEFEAAAGTGPEVLEDASPNAVEIRVPATLREGELASLEINAAQWNTNYNYAYEWTLDGQVISTAALPNFTPGGNTQGPHVLAVRWGQHDGGGSFDPGKPFRRKTFPITISNTVVPIAPLITTYSASVNTTAVQLTLNTGAGSLNCDSFSAMAITEDMPVAPATPGSYTYTCSQAPSQNLLYLLAGGVGTHTLYLWAMDASGNISATPRVATVNYSLIIPNVAITAPLAGTPEQGMFTLSGTCEDDAGDVTLSGPLSGAPLLTSCSGGVFSRAVALSGADGVKSITAAQTNQFGNTGSASLSLVKDTTAPVLTFSSLVPTDTNASSILVNASFNEAVTGFDASKLSVTNGSVSGFAGSGAAYTFTVSPAADGTVTVSSGAGAGVDAAGNASAAAVSFVRNYDSVLPTVTLASAAPNPTKLNDIVVSVAFSEAVSGFTSAGLQLTNATASGLTGSGANYTFHLHPAGQGSFGVAVRAGAASDVAGNPNTVSAVLNRVFDDIGPSLTLSSAASNPTNATPITVSAAFGEVVTGFTLANVTVTNGAASNLVGSGQNYSFDVTPSGNGLVTVAAGSGAGVDAAGNASVAANLSRTFNNNRPSVTIASVRPNPSNLAPFPVTVTFSDAVTGFDASDITVSNATISSFAGSGTSYSFQATPTANGAVALNIAANVAQDAASNQNLASNNLSIVYDTQAPVLDIASPTAGAFANLANQTAFAVSGSCSEEGRNVTVGAGAANASVVCTSGSFNASLDLSALADGALSLSASQTDAAGNFGAAPTVSITKNTVVPTVLLAGQPTGSSNVTTLGITLSGAGVSHYRYKLGITGGMDCTSATGYSSEIAVGTGISDSIAALGDGSIKVCAVGRNAAGNYQAFASATSASWTKDTVVTSFGSLMLTPSSPGKVTNPVVSGTTEAGAGMQLYSAASCGGPVRGSATANGAGAFSVSPSATLGTDGSYTLSVKSTDAAGNTLCSSSVAYLLDTLAPTVVISSAAPANTNGAPISVNLVFSEPVTGLGLAGLTIGNGTASALSGSGTTYSFLITPSGQGNVTALVTAGAATDAAGNLSTASLTLTRRYDTVAPALTIASPVNGASFNTATVTLSGVCEDGLGIDLGGSGLGSPSTATCSAGSYSVAITPTAGEGAKSLTVSQTDLAGNVTTQPISVTKDTVAPILLFTSAGVQNQNTNGNSVTFTGSCETGVSVVVSGTDNGSVSCTGGAWSYATTPRSSDATRAYTFRQTDAAGNSTTISGSWTRDIVLPVVAITSPAANFVAYESITVTGTCENGLPVVLSGAGLLSSINNIPCTSGTFSRLVYFSNGDGVKAVTATQTDLAGNIGNSSRNFTRDTTPPTLTQSLRPSPYYNNANSAQFGGVCESGLDIVVTGSESASTSCTGGSWSYTTVSRNTDAGRTYTFTQTDAAGNQAQISANWVRDTLPPILNLTSASSFTTSGNTVTFSGTCEAGLTVVVSGAQSGNITCAGGTWSFATSQASDNVYNYTFTESDQAMNSSSVTGSWTRSTSGPTLTIAQSTTQVTNTGSLIISGTCSGGTAGSTGIINVTGADTASVTCSSTSATVGSWSYTASQSFDGNYNYTFSLTDNFASPRSTAASLSWMRDTSAPTVSAGSFSINSGQATTAVSYNPVAFSGSDNLSTVSKFCIKESSAIPNAIDACWYPVGGAGTGATPSNAISITNYSFNIGILPKAYTFYLWVMDGAGNLSNNAGIVGTDKYEISLSPIAPPSASTVIVSKSDVMDGSSSERIIPAGNDVYLRWTVTGPMLAAAPITLYFTADDSTWVPIISGIDNGQNNCSSVAGSGPASANATGCYKWNSGSPTNTSYRVRVAVNNSIGSTSFANSLPVNSENLQILAGSSETGLGGSAASAVFQAQYNNPGWVDGQSLVVSSKGTVYFRDMINGLVEINPASGKVKQLIPMGATVSGQGDGGSISAAKLRSPVAIAIDGKDRVVILDYDRIRRVDFSVNPPAISTIVGGGANTADNIAGGTNLKFNVNLVSPAATNAKIPLLALPNGDLYFYTENQSMYAAKRLRIYSDSSNSIRSLYISGSSPTINGGPFAISNASQCGSNSPLFEFDPASSQVTKFYVNLSANSSSGNNTCTSPALTTNQMQTFLKFDYATGAVDTSQLPPVYLSGNTSPAFAATIPALDGKIYLQTKSSAYIHRYDTVSNTFVKLVGTGVRSSCPDGTVATSCAIDPGGAFVDAQSRLYFVDRGRIRTILDGKVVTLYGQSLDFGDGGLAINARFAQVTSVGLRTDGDVVALDLVSSKFRMVNRSGNVNTIAGYGENGSSNSVTVPATQLPVPVSNTSATFYLDGSNDLLFNNPGSVYLRRLPSSYSSLNPTNWAKMLDTDNKEWFTGTTPYYSGSATGSKAGSIQLTGGIYDPRIMGFNGSSTLMLLTNLISGTRANVVWAEVDNFTGVYRILMNTGSSTNSFCVDGTPLSSCGSAPIRNNLVSYDEQNGAWVVQDLNNRSLKKIQFGGSVQAVGMLATQAASYVHKRFPSHSPNEYVYYCSNDDGRIYVRNLQSGIEKAIQWPIQSLKCSGVQMSYSSTTDSIVFPFTQNGLSGVAEVFMVHPAMNGI